MRQGGAGAGAEMIPRRGASIEGVTNVWIERAKCEFFFVKVQTTGRTPVYAMKCLTAARPRRVGRVNDHWSSKD
jgi:hypothetical protein